MKAKFEFLEHVADVYVAARGQSVEEAFENAALAMFEVMTDTSKVKPTVKDEVAIEERDEKALLYTWLEQLLLKFELGEMLFSKFNVTRLVKTNRRWRLRAAIFGERYDPTRHESKVGIKAVTYHQMEIGREDEGYVVKFILDI